MVYVGVIAGMAVTLVFTYLVLRLAGAMERPGSWDVRASTR